MTFVKTTSNTNGSLSTVIPNDMDTITLRNIAITDMDNITKRNIAITDMDTITLRNIAITDMDTITKRNIAITDMDTITLRNASLTSLLNSGTFSSINVTNLNILTSTSKNIRLGFQAGLLNTSGFHK